jgi:serine/threonine protein phosphatase PrpC
MQLGDSLLYLIKKQSSCTESQEDTLPKTTKEIPLLIEIPCQHPQEQLEKDRIEQAGYYVWNQRINGGIAVSRSFGDFAYKHIKVLKAAENGCHEYQITVPYSGITGAMSAVPDVKEFKLNDIDQVLIATDGLIENTNINLVKNPEFVRLNLEELLEMSWQSTDDTTLMKIHLP